MPGPWSSTVSTPLASRTVTVLPSGPHLAALSSRLVTARSMAPDSPTTHHGRVSTSSTLRGARSRTRRHGAVDDLGEVEGLHHVGERLVAGQLDQVPDEGGELLELRADVVQQLLALLGRQPAGGVGLGEQVEVRAQRGQRRAQLVAGVGDQPALAVARRGQRDEHRVERRGEPGDLVVALDGQRRELARCGRSPRRRSSGGVRVAGRCAPPPSRRRPRRSRRPGRRAASPRPAA